MIFISCGVIKSSHLVGKKWSIPILEEIALGNFEGFNKFLAKSKDITPKILSMQLKEMESIGLIAKRGNGATKYTLTAKGVEFYKIIKSVKKWNIRWNKASEKCLKTSCIECPIFSKLS